MAATTSLSQYISKIGNYFKLFNVVEGVEYVLVKFPDKWVIPSNTSLMKAYSTQTSVDEKGLYFYSDIENGIDPLFKAVLYTIKYNRNIEEKIVLLKKKAAELKELFANESLARLKTLRFTMDDEDELNNKLPKAISKKAEVVPVEDNESDEEEITDDEQVVNEVTTETIDDKVEAMSVSNSGSLFDMALQMTGEVKE